jgi:hypothetical protein
MASKADFKNLFQSSLKDMLSKKEKQKKEESNMELDDESLDMNVFNNFFMEGKHNESISNNVDDSMSTEYEKKVLGKTFKKFPTLFLGGSGKLNIKPVRL